MRTATTDAIRRGRGAVAGRLALRSPSALPGGVRMRFGIVLACAIAGSGWTTEVTPGKSRPIPPAAAGRPKMPPAAAAPTLNAPAAAAGVAAGQGSGDAVARPAPRPPAQRVPRLASSVVALAAALEVDATSTSLVLTLTRAAQFATFTLADPYRVVVDLQDVEFKLPPLTGRAGRGLVKSFRFGLLAPGKSRIVIDVSAPVRIDKAAIVALRGAETVQLRVSLMPTDRDQFLAAAFGTPAHLPSALTATGPGGAPAIAGGAGAPEIAKPRKGARPVIVLDPGHGGIDAGTLGSTNVAEKDVVLRFAKLLRDKLRATGRFDVHLTREIDVFLKLDERVRVARSRGCDLFISLHTDSVPPQHAHLNVRGATIYTMSAQDSDARAQKLAEKENLSDVVAGVENLQDEEPEVAGILTDLMRRETATTSHAFTGTLMDYMKKSTGLSREPHRNAAFKVLRAPDMPSVLVELGYLSNQEDEKLLVSKEWQEHVAGAVGRAVEAFFAKRVARTPY